MLFRSITAAIVAAVVVAGVGGAATLVRKPAAIDDTKLVTVERGRIVRSVVATGRIEPITKVEIKSKANGIIERLAVNVDDRITAGQVLAELDRENLAARAREARAALEAAQASREAAVAQMGKSEIEAVFKPDEGRSIYTIPLDERRRQIEEISWVHHASVSRVMPNEIWVRVEERVPVAFLWSPKGASLVDGEGVLLDAPPETYFNLPVVRGVAQIGRAHV